MSDRPVPRSSKGARVAAAEPSARNDAGHASYAEARRSDETHDATVSVDDRLTVIRGYVQLLAEDPSFPSSLRTVLAQIARAADGAAAAYPGHARSLSQGDPRAGVPQAGARSARLRSATADLVGEHAGSPGERLAGGQAVHALLALSAALTDGVAVTNMRGRVLHENAAFARLLTADPDGPPLRTLLDDIVRTLGAAARQRPDGPLVAARERRTERAAYRVQGAWLGGNGDSAAEPAVLVTLTIEPSCVTECDPESRFGLTRREGEVARLLARGLTNAELAGALDISKSTASRHTERVFAKLGVHSRAAVADALQRVPSRGPARPGQPAARRLPISGLASGAHDRRAG